jgi:ribonuclease HI
MPHRSQDQNWKSMWPFVHRQAISVHLHVYHHHPHASHSLSRPLAVAVRCCSSIMPKEPQSYYAVRVGRKPGIYTTWLHSTPLLLSAILLTLCVTREDCREQVNQYGRAVFKKLRTLDAAAEWYAGGPVEQRSTPHPTRSETKSDSLPSHSQTRSSVGLSPPTKAPSSSPVIAPTPAAPLAGRSDASARAGPSKPTGSSSSTAFEDVVYTDGACSRNGQAGSVAGIGVWWGPNDPR